MRSCKGRSITADIRQNWDNYHIYLICSLTVWNIHQMQKSRYRWIIFWSGFTLQIKKNTHRSDITSPSFTELEEIKNNQRIWWNLVFPFSIHQTFTRCREEILWPGERNGAIEGGDEGLESSQRDRQGTNTAASSSLHHHNHPYRDFSVPLCFTSYCMTP